jgi:acetone carboxylase gamma subunit
MKRLSSNLYLDVVDGREMVHCRCGSVLGPGDRDAKSLLSVRHADLSKAGPNVNPHRLGAGRFFLREYYCPACLGLIETEVALKET